MDRERVRALPVWSPSAIYEAAVVLCPPPAVVDLVWQLRMELRLDAPREHQLAPHATVLFLGQWPGERMQGYAHTVLNALSSASVSCSLDGFGTFTRRDRVTNIHLRLAAADGLRGLHKHAIASLTGTDWLSSSRYIRELYVPHISVLDGLDARLSMVAPQIARALPRWSIVLDEPHMIGRFIR